MKTYKKASFSANQSYCDYVLFSRYDCHRNKSDVQLFYYFYLTKHSNEFRAFYAKKRHVDTLVWALALFLFYLWLTSWCRGFSGIELKYHGTCYMSTWFLSACSQTLRP